MMPISSLSFRFALLATGLLISACDGNIDYAQYRTDLKTGDRVSLYLPPDSLYIAEIDRRLASEPLTEEARKKRSDVAISISPGKSVDLPKGIGRSGFRPEGVEIPSLSPVTAAPVAEKNTPQKSTAPRFVPHFMGRLESLLVNPTAAGVAERVVPEQGENLQQLLVRRYGPEAQRLPMSVVSYQLKLVNPGIDFEQLNESADLLLPKL